MNVSFDFDAADYPQTFKEMLGALKEQGLEPGFWEMNPETAKNRRYGELFYGLPIVYSRRCPPGYVYLREQCAVQIG